MWKFKTTSAEHEQGLQDIHNVIHELSVWEDDDKVIIDISETLEHIFIPSLSRMVLSQ